MNNLIFIFNNSDKKLNISLSVIFKIQINLSAFKFNKILSVTALDERLTRHDVPH